MEPTLIVSCGWLRGRMASDNESSGQGMIVPGLQFRIRLDDILMYQSIVPNVVLLWLKDNLEPIELYATLEEVDNVMDSVNLREVVA